MGARGSKIRDLVKEETVRNDHIKRLERRRDWLQSQVDSTRSDLSYIKSELSALKFAIGSMEFVKDGFYEIITDKELNLTIEQISRLILLKNVKVKEEM